MSKDDSEFHGERHEHHRVTDSTSGQFRTITLTDEPASIIETGRFTRVVRWLTRWKVLLPILLTVGSSIIGAGAWACGAYLDKRDEKRDVAAHLPMMQRLDKIDARNTRSDLEQAKIKTRVNMILQFMPRTAVAQPLPPEETETP
jgi:hypothetical protein